MLTEKVLPFPRGTTYSQCGKDGTGALVTMADATAKELEGRLYQVRDTLHGTGQWITLRCVKNDNGDTAFALDRKLVYFNSASAGDYGRRVGGLTTANIQGRFCKPMDDAYYYGVQDTSATSARFHTCAAMDLFYVVDEGPCRVLHETTTLISAGDPGASSAFDGIAQEAADADYPFGTAMEDGDTAAHTATLYYVAGGIHGWEHA